MSTQVDGAAAELASIIETADLIAHDGLSPGSDGPRILAGLISQLATQIARLLDSAGSVSTEQPQSLESPQEADVRTEEDISPRDASAEPAREV